MHPTLPRESLWGHVTFDDVTSGLKAPLGRIVRKFRLHMHGPHPSKGTPLVTLHPVAMLDMRNGIFLCYYCRKKKAREPVAHAHTITSGHVISGHDSFGDVTSGSSTSFHLKSDFDTSSILLANVGRHVKIKK